MKITRIDIEATSEDLRSSRTLADTLGAFLSGVLAPIADRYATDKDEEDTDDTGRDAEG